MLEESATSVLDSVRRVKLLTYSSTTVIHGPANRLTTFGLTTSIVFSAMITPWEMTRPILN